MRDLLPEDIDRWVDKGGWPPYRADQVLGWLYKKPVSGLEGMTNVPADVREALADEFELALPEVRKKMESADGTVKLAFSLSDGETIESVMIPDDGRRTLCVSSQAGCRMACRFCRTGKSGLKRHLSPSEIIGQAIVANEMAGKITNLVIMGMGEPLDNPENLFAALDIMCDERGLAISPRRITLSTIGIVDELSRVISGGPPVNLAVSLHSAVQETRMKLLPVAGKTDLGCLKAALKKFPSGTRRKLTLETVLLAGVNDSIEEARAMAVYASDLEARVNIIRFNPFPGSGYCAPDEESVLAYQRQLKNKGVSAFIRKSRGQDILAACGQLAGEGDCS